MMYGTIKAQSDGPPDTEEVTVEDMYAALAEAEVMCQNMRLYGTIDAPKASK